MDNENNDARPPRRILYDSIIEKHKFLLKKENNVHLAIYEKDSTRHQYTNFKGIQAGMLIIDFHLKSWPKGSPVYRGIFKVLKKSGDRGTYFAEAIQNGTPFIFPNEEESIRKQYWKKFIQHLISGDEGTRDVDAIGERAILFKIQDICRLMKDFLSNKNRENAR